MIERAVPDAGAIAASLAARRVSSALNANVYDPADLMDKLFFNILATFAEFEADRIRLHIRDGMANAPAKGKPSGKKPKPSDRMDNRQARRRACLVR